MTKPDQAVWCDVLSYLRARHPAMCRQWFEEIDPLGIRAGVFHARISQAVRQRYLQRECASQFNEALQAVTGSLVSIRFVCGEEELDGPPIAAALNGTNGHARAPARRAGKQGDGLRRPAPVVASVAPARAQVSEPPPVIPDYCFENFVVGPETRMSFAAAQAVADKPGQAYNPLFIHGGVGLGKTHLLHAICLRLHERNPELAISYLSCEEFMTRFIDAVQAGEMADFRNRFREVDVLVIDDIHFLAKRDRTQEEFFHTFNALYHEKRQIVLSSDAPPNEIPDLEQRLVSRFQCGLVVQVAAPCFETRVAIVEQKARLRLLSLPPDVAAYIAAGASSNIRELEGAVIKVQLQHSLEQHPIDMDMARRALEPGSPALRPEITITNIIDAVTAYYGVKLSDLQSKRRQKSIAHPRQVCMYLARKHTRYSLAEIGGYFGGRDHTTVMHAVKTTDSRRGTDSDFDRVLQGLEQRFRGSLPVQFAPPSMPPAPIASTPAPEPMLAAV